MFPQHQVSASLDKCKSICTLCLEGKFTKLPFVFPTTKSTHPLEILHSDVWGPALLLSYEGYRYYVTFIDECTRFTWIFPLSNKSEVFALFVKFHAFLCTQFSAKVKILQSDGGGEYTTSKFQSFLTINGIVHQKSCPYTPKQNGLAEKKHRHIVETAITLLQNAKLPNLFWFHACATATYLINRMPCVTLQMHFPYQLLYG